MNTATLGYDTYYLVPVGYVVENPYKDPANIPKWTGHYFIGWENIYNKDVIINEYGDVIVDENYTSVFFEAQYAAYKYTVRFDANGGEGTMADQTHTYDSSYDYSASFVQSKAGTYILKVEFRKYVYDGTAWTDSGIVTVETEYTVMGEVLGESDTPDTGDNGISVMVMLNIMLVSAFGLIACVRWHKRRKNSI